MGLSSLGPSGLDPFTSTPAEPVDREAAEPAPDAESREPAPLPEGVGTQVDTSA